MSSARESASAVSTPRPPPPTHVLETCLYVRSMSAALGFYRDVLGLSPQLEAERLSVMPLGQTTLILFQLGLTEKDFATTTETTGNKLTIPGHGPDKAIVDLLLDAKTATPVSTGDNDRLGVQGINLRTHYCLAVPSKNDVDAWESYLKSKDVKLRGVMEWERGGKSVYFEDVDGHVGEIGSRGIWVHY